MTDLTPKEKGILVVGSPLASTLKALREKTGIDNILVVSNPDMGDTIEINGIKYQKIPNKKFSGQGIKSGTIDELMGSMYSIPITNRYDQSPPKERRISKDIDIIEEFKLIQSKKSKLSRYERDWVVKQFNKSFVKLEQ